MALKTLEKTFLYNHLNKSNHITKNIANSLSKGDRLTYENLEEAFMSIMKNYKYPLKHKIIDEVKKGNIILVYSPRNVKVPQYIPFILTRDNNTNVVAIVFVDIWSNKRNDETGDVKIDPKKLYCLIEAAYLARVCYHYNKQVSSKTPIITNGSAIYSQMFTKVLNKKYALNIDKNKYHKVLFLSSKFFITNILGIEDSDMVFNYCVKNCPNANIFSLKEVNEAVDESDFENIKTFIKALARPSTGLGMKDLTVRSYLEAFINMYDSTTLLALESFQYFIFNVNAVTNGAYINNQYILEEIVGPYGAKLYTAMMSIDN